MENTSSQPKSKSKASLFELAKSVVMFFSGILILLNSRKYYGSEILYIYTGCYALFLISVWWCTAELVKLIKRREFKKYHIAYAVIVLALVVIWSLAESYYAKDIFGGTKTITTEYYNPFEEKILINQEFDGEHYNTLSLKCSKKVSAPVRENFHWDESEKMKVLDHIWVYRSIPKIEIEYYPNTEIIKEITIL